MEIISQSEAIKSKLITVEEEVEAITAWQKNKDPNAMKLLMTSHARICFAEARLRAKNAEHIKDLASEGMLGIIRAAEKFDLTRGIRFSTYARLWIRTYITSSLSNVTSVIDVPSRVYLDTKSGKASESVRAKSHMAVFGGVSLDAPLGDDEDAGTVMDLLECPRENPEEAAHNSSASELRKRLLVECLGMLGDRERDIITRRKLASEPETLEALSKEFNVTRERVRQIESRGMTQLKRYLVERGFSIEMLRE